MAKKKIEKLSGTIAKLLASRGRAGKMKEYRLVGQWVRAVGPVIARHTQPAAIRARKLTVIVDSSAWMQQLSLLKPEIIAKVNQCLGEDAVESLTLRLGEIAFPAPVRHEHRPLAGKLDDRDRRKADELTVSIRDPEVREAFRKLVEKDLLSKKQAGTRKE